MGLAESDPRINCGFERKLRTKSNYGKSIKVHFFSSVGIMEGCKANQVLYALGLK